MNYTVLLFFPRIHFMNGQTPCYPLLPLLAPPVRADSGTSPHPEIFSFREINILTPMDRQFSSPLLGNLTTNLDPAFSSLSFRGRKRHTTLILSSAGNSALSGAPLDMVQFLHFNTPQIAQCSRPLSGRQSTTGHSCWTPRRLYSSTIGNLFQTIAATYSFQYTPQTTFYCTLESHQGCCTLSATPIRHRYTWERDKSI